MSDAHNEVRWNRVMRAAYNHRAGLEYEIPLTAEAVAEAQNTYKELTAAITAEDWTHGDFKEEMLLAVEGICVLAELGAKLAGAPVERLTDTEAFLGRYRNKWLQKNKISELTRIEDIFRYMENI